MRRNVFLHSVSDRDAQEIGNGTTHWRERGGVTAPFCSPPPLAPFGADRVKPGFLAQPQSLGPTGTTGFSDIPFTTPAAEAYQATAAVTMPAQPPACSHQALWP